jgi:hypothetical protein
MADTPTEVLRGGYPAIDEAVKDVDVPAEPGQGAGDQDRSWEPDHASRAHAVNVCQTADHRGRSAVRPHSAERSG